jgi:hypothetical protein
LPGPWAALVVGAPVGRTHVLFDCDPQNGEVGAERRCEPLGVEYRVRADIGRKRDDKAALRRFRTRRH